MRAIGAHLALLCEHLTVPQQAAIDLFTLGKATGCSSAGVVYSAINARLGQDVVETGCCTSSIQTAFHASAREYSVAPTRCQRSLSRMSRAHLRLS